MHPLGVEFPAVSERFELILANWRGMPCRTEVSLWDLLWRLCEEIEPSGPGELVGLPAVVETALGIIDNEFASSTLNANNLAVRIGVSYGHLNRLFRSCLDTSVGGYLAQRRVETARHLLVDGKLPVSTVAQMVGIPDLQSFNKFIRRHCGVPPRSLREESVEGEEA
jgi:methylphosphotriester-DNA--protein-cysteine methyltransferase